MSVYKYLEYRKSLEEIFRERRSSLKRWTLRQLAIEAGLQPSFLTNVLKGRAEFNADQLYALVEKLGLSRDEREYLLLLLDHHRCVHRARKIELRARIDEVRRDHQRTEKHISAKAPELNANSMAEYYLDPLVQLTHVHLQIPPYDREPQLLCKTIGVSENHLARLLETLVRIGYVRKESGRYKVVTKGLHLAKENPLCNPHQALLRIRSVDHMQRLEERDKYSFSVTFSGSDETRATLQEAFLAFLKKAESIVGPAPSEQAMQMNFDLFTWKI